MTVRETKSSSDLRPTRGLGQNSAADKKKPESPTVKGSFTTKQTVKKPQKAEKRPDRPDRQENNVVICTICDLKGHWPLQCVDIIKKSSKDAMKIIAGKSYVSNVSEDIGSMSASTGRTAPHVTDNTANCFIKRLLTMFQAKRAAKKLSQRLQQVAKAWNHK